MKQELRKEAKEVWTAAKMHLMEESEAMGTLLKGVSRKERTECV